MVLILISYLTNGLSMGAVIMMIHDFTDCLVSIFKITADVMNSKMQTASVVAMVAGWIYFRLWFFPFYLIQRYYDEVHD